MSIRAIACAGFLFAAGSAEAGVLRLAGGIWDYSVSGYDVDNGVTRDFERDLAIKPGARLRLAAEYDWRESWYPDLAASYSQYGGEGRVTASGAAGGNLLFPGGGTTVLNTSADLSDAEVTARWPLQLGDLLFSPGLSLKRLSGDVVIEDSARQTQTTQKLDQIFPQFHGDLYWSLHPRFALSATVQAVSYGDNAANEWRVLATWQVYGPVLLQAGWQQKNLDAKQRDFEIHARLKGALVALGVVL